MNINFNINGGTVAVGRKTREFFSAEIKKSEEYPGSFISMVNNGDDVINDKKDNGVEWELCESLGLNPAKYVGRIVFYNYRIEKTEDNTYVVNIWGKKAA